MSEPRLDDPSLIARATAGDDYAFDLLIRRHEARAYQYAFRLTRDPEIAADVVAEAFVRVHHALPNFKGQSAFTTWLYRILTNCFLDMKKKDKSKQTTSLDATLSTPDGEMSRQFEDPGGTPQDQMERTEREERMEEAIDQLPPYQRAMIVMYHGEMMSYEDIAAALDLPIGTVKSRLNRARLSLRELLMKHEELFRTQ